MLEDERLTSQAKECNLRTLRAALSQRTEELGRIQWDSLKTTARRLAWSQITNRSIDNLRVTTKKRNADVRRQTRRNNVSHDYRSPHQAKRRTGDRGSGEYPLLRKIRLATAPRITMVNRMVVPQNETSRARQALRMLKEPQTGMTLDEATTTRPSLSTRRKHKAAMALHAAQLQKVKWIGETVRKTPVDLPRGAVQWSRRMRYLAKRKWMTEMALRRTRRQASRAREGAAKTPSKSTTRPLQWSRQKLVLAEKKRVAAMSLHATKPQPRWIGETVRKMPVKSEAEEGPLQWSRRRIVLARRQDRLRRDRSWEAIAGSQGSFAGLDMPAFPRLRTEEQRQLADDVYKYMSSTAV